MKKNSNLSSSIIIALIAVLISSVSAYISLKESRIMLEQQKLMSEQQEASVWPYLENIKVITTISDTEFIYKFVVTNKGIGPAIINDVTYKLGEEITTGWGLGDLLIKKYPNLDIYKMSNSTLDRIVLSPGESKTVITVKLKKSESDTTDIMRLLNEMEYYLEYCYCSVYNKCWKVESKDILIRPSENCEFNINIR